MRGEAERGWNPDERSWGESEPGRRSWGGGGEEGRDQTINPPVRRISGKQQ